MANLNIFMSGKFETENLISHSKITFQNECLSGLVAAEYFAKCAADDIAMYVVATDPITGEANISFEFGIKSMKKSSIFETSMNADNTGLVVNINGNFSVKLRAGVAESLPPGVIFKLQGICCKGGSYRGFMAYLSGQNEDNVTSWFQINDAQIK